MGCCGQKRMQLKQDMRRSAYQEPDVLAANDEKEMNPKLFQYFGNDRLTVKGISTGVLYNFTCHGEKLEVNYYDSFAMMAECYLKVVS